MGITNEKTIPEVPRYMVKNKRGWGIEMNGTEASDGTDIFYAGRMGFPILNLAIESSKIKKVRVCNKRGKWLPYKVGFDPNGVGDDTMITGIEIVGAGLKYSIHTKGGGWFPIFRTSDTENDVLAVSAAGIDAIWVDEI